nr:hypothetical protein 2 [bacterium]
MERCGGFLVAEGELLDQLVALLLEVANQLVELLSAAAQYVAADSKGRTTPASAFGAGGASTGLGTGQGLGFTFL